MLKQDVKGRLLVDKSHLLDSQQPFQHRSKLYRVLVKLGIGDQVVYKLNASTRVSEEVLVSARERQVAFLEALDALGAFDLKAAENGFLRLSKHYGWVRSKPSEAFNHFAKVISASADKNSLKSFGFKGKYDYILDKLFSVRSFTEKDVADFILYLATLSFYNSKFAPVEAKVKGRFWRSLLRSSNNFGLIGSSAVSSEIPRYFNSSIWFVLGGYRSSVLNRLSFFKSFIDNDKLEGYRPSCVVLSHGCRRLVCSKDSAPNQGPNGMEECIGYMTMLARRSGIKPDGEDLFVIESSDGLNRKKEKVVFNDGGNLNEFLMLAELYGKIVGNIPYTHSSDSCDNSSVYQYHRGFSDADIVHLLKESARLKLNTVIILSAQPYYLADVASVRNAINRLKGSVGMGRKIFRIIGFADGLPGVGDPDYFTIRDIAGGLLSIVEEGYTNYLHSVAGDSRDFALLELDRVSLVAKRYASNYFARSSVE